MSDSEGGGGRGGPTYRFEVSKTNRAGCQNSRCKHDNVKILKGELRMGTLFQVREADAWAWKHWGCVTPVQIANIQKIVAGLDLDTDLDVLDGWEELTPDYQAKIKKAIQDGHVDDADWKGDPELNRPGQKGINKRTPKKKEAEDDEDAEPGASPSKKPTKSKKSKEADAEEEDAPTSPKKKKTQTKRKAADSDVQDEPAPRKRATKKRKAAEPEIDGESDQEAPPPTSKRAKAKASKQSQPIATDDADAEAPVPPSKQKRKKAVKTEPVDDDDAANIKDEATSETEIKPRKSKSRSKTSKQVEADTTEDPSVPTSKTEKLKLEDDDVDVKSVPTRKGRKVKQETEAEDPAPAPVKKGRGRKTKA